MFHVRFVFRLCEMNMKIKCVNMCGYTNVELDIIIALKTPHRHLWVDCVKKCGSLDFSQLLWVFTAYYSDSFCINLLYATDLKHLLHKILFFFYTRLSSFAVPYNVYVILCLPMCFCSTCETRSICRNKSLYVCIQWSFMSRRALVPGCKAVKVITHIRPVCSLKISGALSPHPTPYFTEG
jgi:hypothetical protein